MSGSRKRLHALLSAFPPLVLFAGPAVLFLLWGREELHAVQGEVLVLITAFALWRYGWQLLHYVRAGWYAGWHYPRLRAAARQVAQTRPWPQRVFVVVPSYLEEPWVSSQAMQSLMINLLALPGNATVVVAVGSDEDEAVITAACGPYLGGGRVELVF